jgi:hypothetical protein
VPREYVRRRHRRQEVGRRDAAEFGRDGPEIGADQIAPQRLGERGTVSATERMEERALNEARAKTGQQRRQSLRAAPRGLRGVELPPEGEGRRRPHGRRVPQGGAEDEEHLVDLVGQTAPPSSNVTRTITCGTSVIVAMP